MLDKISEGKEDMAAIKEATAMIKTWEEVVVVEEVVSADDEPVDDGNSKGIINKVVCDMSGTALGCGRLLYATFLSDQNIKALIWHCDRGPCL